MTYAKKFCLGLATVAALGLSGAANALVVVATGTPGTTGASGLYPTLLGELSTSDGTATLAELNSFLGTPDDSYTGLGSAWIQYDFGDFVRIINGVGQDFNVYEVDNGAVEFGSVDVLVSLDGANWANVDNTSAAAIDLAGDEAHGNASFRRSFEISGALAALGVSELRYIRLQGTSGSAIINGNSGFDPDAVGLVNWVDRTPAVPEPASWAMMIGGFGLAGAALRRRVRVALAA